VHCIAAMYEMRYTNKIALPMRSQIRGYLFIFRIKRSKRKYSGFWKYFWKYTLCIYFV